MKEARSKNPPQASNQIDASNTLPHDAKDQPSTSSRAPGSSKSQVPEEEVIDDDYTAQPPSSPKASNPSFLSSAFRRLSTNSQTQAQAGALAQAPQCHRQILNVDEGRPRCSVKGLDQAKLRRVSFNVDVEVAGSSRYIPEDDEDIPEVTDKKSKKKDNKLKERGEGEALKHPEIVTKEKEQDGVVRTSGEKVPKEHDSPDSNDAFHSQLFEHSNPPPLSPAQDRRSNQEAPRAIDQSSKQETQSPLDGPPPTTTGPELQPQTLTDPKGNHAKHHDKPTTDPLRVYRRCCQLREAPVLKRITEQLGNPNNVGVEAPGVVTCLNLNRSRLQLQDVICLGDWLAVVPVKTLLFDEANLTDEGVRVVLAGLLAAKPPELCKRKRGRSSPTRLRDNSIQRSPGIIEKLTLKGNKKLTAESWRHICLFLNLCKSIKAVDLSMIQFPKSSTRLSMEGEAASKQPQDIAELLRESLSCRQGGDNLLELTFGECSLEDYHVSKICAAASTMRLARLGLAGNNLTAEGLRHVASYLRANVCKGLDLGGIDLHGKLSPILEALERDTTLQALSLSHSNLEPQELTPLFQRFVTMSDFRFLDLSHNHKLFSQSPSALAVMRTYLPKLHLLKRLHLMDVAMSPADAVGIAEVIPDIRNLAHLNILENSQIRAVVESTESDASEEACALYASLMTAVRLSKTMVCVDIDVPGPSATEVVRALARQVVAYCLRNMELFAQGDALRVADAAAALPDVSGGYTDVLKDVGGHSEQQKDNDMSGLSASAKNEDYLVGGQGWVKALSHCLNAADMRRMSADGTNTPTQVIESEAGKVQAKEMSKDLLISARAFRQRLEIVLAREEASSAESDVLSKSKQCFRASILPIDIKSERLQFLDQTILSIIQRFEREFPETRLPSSKSITSPIISAEPGAELIDSTTYNTPLPPYNPFFSSDNPPSHNLQSADVSPSQLTAAMGPRRGSATDLAAFAQASEEAKAHRFGQRFRREVLPPKGQEDLLHGTTKDQLEPAYDAELRRRLEELGGEDIKERIRANGWEATVQEFFEEKQKLRRESMAAEGARDTSGEVKSGPYRGV